MGMNLTRSPVSPPTLKLQTSPRVRPKLRLKRFPDRRSPAHINLFTAAAEVSRLPYMELKSFSCYVPRLFLSSWRLDDRVGAGKYDGVLSIEVISSGGHMECGAIYQISWLI